MHPPVSQDRLSSIVHDTVEAAARRHVGLAVGAFCGAATSVHTSGTGGSGRGALPVDTLFQIGSVTKVFTALALADAVVAGELDLTTPLTALLPEAAAHRHTRMITLEHLASHTSGLSRLPKGLRRRALRHPSDPYRDFASEDLVAALAAARPRRAPGRRVRYSNFGMALLGAALCRHSGMPYERLVEARVTAPLGLTDTVIVPSAAQAARLAVGHSRRRAEVPDWDLGGMPGAGALRSTVSDQLALLRAHLDPSTSPMPAALALVQQPHARANRFVQVALGWHLSPVRGTSSTALWHNGGTGGSSSYVALLRDARIGVVVLSNMARPVDPLGARLLRRIAEAGPAAYGLPEPPTAS